MRGLLAAEIIQSWEWGEDKHSVDRALGLLALVQPELTSTQIAQLSVGQRNSRLITIRAQTIGATLNCYAECLKCGEELEFNVETNDLLLPEPEQHEFTLEVSGYELQWRLPNSVDLAAIVGFQQTAAARHLLVESCILAAHKDGQNVDVAELPSDIIPSLADAVTTYDPQAEMRFSMSCPECGHEWSVQFDIVSFFWAELGDRVKRLLHEVDVLARTYGWRESDILSMSTTRRQFYLDLITGEP